MITIADKAAFLKDSYIPSIRTIDSNTFPLFGKMNVQQMIEHMAEYIRMAYGDPVVEIQTPAEHLGRMRDFLVSEKPFRDNTPNALMPDSPVAPKHADIATSINELEASIAHLFATFEKESGKEVANPFFGVLDYPMTIQLLYKHALHHLRQFGVSIS